MGWLIAGGVVLLIVVLSYVFEDPNTVAPCPQCGGKMAHMPGWESGSTAEAQFKCGQCDHREYRGGLASEFQYERNPRD